MKALGLLVLLFPFVSYAENTHGIECTAQVYESFENGSARHEKVPLEIEIDNAAHLVLSVDLDKHGFVLNGPKSGPYRLSIVDAPDYQKGALTTADFSKDGRLQISTVNGPLVYKLECFKKDR